MKIDINTFPCHFLHPHVKYSKYLYPCLGNHFYWAPFWIFSELNKMELHVALSPLNSSKMKRLDKWRQKFWLHQISAWFPLYNINCLSAISQMLQIWGPYCSMLNVHSWLIVVVLRWFNQTIARFCCALCNVRNNHSDHPFLSCKVQYRG